MGSTHIAIIVLAFSMSWLPASCSKNSTAKSPRPAATAAADNTNAVKVTVNGRTHNLGDLTLAEGKEKFVQIAPGKSCTITPRTLDKNTVQLTIALQSEGADGKITGLNVLRVNAQPGQECDVQIGDMELAMTPEIQ